MLHKKSFNAVQCCIAAALIALNSLSLAQAADSRIESIPPTIRDTDAQPDSHQPQQAVPAQPASGTEPVDGDETALV